MITDKRGFVRFRLDLSLHSLEGDRAIARCKNCESGDMGV